MFANTLLFRNRTRRLNVTLKRHSSRLILVMILVLATILRVWGINFGLPHPGVRHDELLYMSTAMRFASGDLNPHFFDYPSLYFYTLFLLYMLYFIIGSTVGRFDSTIAFLREFALEPTNFFLINRLLSVFCGIATVWAVYKVSLLLFNKRTSLLSALFLSLTYLSVRESHFGKMDTAVTFLITLSVLFILKIYENGRWRSYFLAGLFSGLATSTKQIGFLLILPLSFAHLLRFFKMRKKTSFLPINRLVIGAFWAFGLAFFIGTPFAILDWPTFITDMTRVLNIVSQPWYGVNVGSGWLYHLRVSFYYGLGWGMLTAGGIGMIFLLKKNLPQGVIFLSFPLAYYALIGSNYTAPVRYALPLVPFIAVTTAFFVDKLVSFLKQRFSAFFSKNFTLIFTCFIIAPNLLLTIQFNMLITKRDNRLIAADWINSNLEGGSSIYQAGSWLGIVQLPSSIATLAEQQKLLRKQPASQTVVLKLKIIDEKIEYLQKSNRAGFNVWTYPEDKAIFSFNSTPQTELPDYIIRYQSPLLIDKATSSINPSILRLLDESYTLQETFLSMDSENKANIFDHQDAFYVPFAGFEGVLRPGPNIFVYQRKE